MKAIFLIETDIMYIVLKSKHKKTALLSISELMDTLKDLKCCMKRSSVDKPLCTCFAFDMKAKVLSWEIGFMAAKVVICLFRNRTVAFDIAAETTYEWGNTRVWDADASFQSQSPYSPGTRYLQLTLTIERSVATCVTAGKMRGQVSGCSPPVFWKTTDLQSHIHLTQQFAPNARRI